MTVGKRKNNGGAVHPVARRADSKAAAKAMTIARVNLIANYPWYGALALKLRVRERLDIPTMATDGTSLYYNPGYTLGLTDRERYAVVAHEVLHCAFLHMYRKGTRNMLRWNMATDFVINLELQKNGFHLPKGVLLDSKWDGKSAEYVYAQLEAAQDGDGDGGSQDGAGDGTGEGGGWNVGGFEEPKPEGAGGDGQEGDGQDGEGGGDGKDGGDGTGKGRALTESDWRIAVTQATKVCEGAGRMPGSLARAVDQIFEPVVDWRAVLKRFIAAVMPCDYSFAHPNRRFMGPGRIMLPGTVKEGCGEIVVAVDTSGSITPQMLSQFSAELREIVGEVKPERTHVVYCDADVCGTAVFEPMGQDVELEMHGGGGTAFTPVFDWVREQGIEPKCLVYLTDLECFDRPEDPGYPVLWVTPEWQTDVFPWGETIRMREGGK